MLKTGRVLHAGSGGAAAAAPPSPGRLLCTCPARCLHSMHSMRTFMCVPSLTPDCTPAHDRHCPHRHYAPHSSSLNPLITPHRAEGKAKQGTAWHGMHEEQRLDPNPSSHNTHLQLAWFKPQHTYHPGPLNRNHQCKSPSANAHTHTQYTPHPLWQKQKKAGVRPMATSHQFETRPFDQQY